MVHLGPSTTSQTCLAVGAKSAGHPPRTSSVSWAELGYPADRKVRVRDLWLKKDLGIFPPLGKPGQFSSSVAYHEAQIFTFTTL